MVIRHVCVVVVTVYLALNLVVLSRLTRKMATFFLAVVRARRFAVSAVAGHESLPTFVCVIVAELVKFRG